VHFSKPRFALTDCIANRRLRYPELVLLVGLLFVGFNCGFGHTFAVIEPSVVAQCALPAGTSTSTSTTCSGLTELWRLPLDVKGKPHCCQPDNPRSAVVIA
jgi:hypothetical protein